MYFQDVITALNRCGLHRIKPGLGRMRVACERLGHPEHAAPCVHVAGTNGKGSTIAFLESILRADRYSVGRYISPHLHDIRERIATNGRLISQVEFVDAYETVSAACADLQPSYFEWLTLMAFVHFREHPVDILLLETGMGGRWDATNVVTPLVSVITTIDYDHQAFLGDTLAQIAGEKCGILKPNAPVIIAQQSSEVMEVIRDRVSEMGLHAQIAQPLPANIPLGLAGDHQRQNAALAVAAARLLSEKGLSIHEWYEPLTHTTWPGRLEWISKNPPILCDVAHNPGGMRAIVEYMESHFSSPRGEEITILLGVMSDKDAAGMVRGLSEIADTFFCVSPNTPRALPAGDLVKLVRAAGKTAITTTITGMKHWTGPGLLVVTGSFYTVGEFCEKFGSSRN